uniref:RNA helicase n=1 Tax=Glossina brevipalpis TaxID=37001 RepID=A0A1A9X0T9_9MUSC
MKSTYNRNRPPGLKGREIGLFYRNLARKRKEEEKSEGHIHLNPSVSVPTELLNRVESYLNKFAQSEDEAFLFNEFGESFRRLLSMNFEEFIEEAKQQKAKNGKELSIAKDAKDELSKVLQSEFIDKCSAQPYRKRNAERENLPATSYHKVISDCVRKNQVILIVGGTGCGKTTQVPQILLDNCILNRKGAECRIVCTQPRRIAAITVAERVAYERAESLGQSVGYQIRLESQWPRDYGSILYCTTGIMLQRMQNNPLLNDVSILILDEIHERSVETDLLMALLKKILPHRSDLKVILMSATVNDQLFTQYFDNCCTVRIEGSLYPVEMLYLEDILQETGYRVFKNEICVKNKNHHRKRRKETEQNIEYLNMIDAYIPTIREKYESHVLRSLRFANSEGCENLHFIEYLIFFICEHKPKGAILVFLPSYDKISKLNAQLQKPLMRCHQDLAKQLIIYPLHSMMPTINQKDVFEPAPEGKRKVILSTIIAETSVTINDVVYVINPGRMKTSDYDSEANTQTLEETWVSKANTQQRKGRAGRVQPGICYNIFSKAREQEMMDEPIPEIKRSRLETVILNLKLLHLNDLYEFLKSLISAPESLAIQNGINLLKRIGALDYNDALTPLGLHLARLPIDPQMGKMILMAGLFRCVDPITSAAAGISFKSPFYTPLGFEQTVDRVKRELSDGIRSDHLLTHRTLRGFREARESGRLSEYCYRKFLSNSILTQLENMKKQFADHLKLASFTESSDVLAESLNVNSNNLPLLRAIIASGLYPNVAYLRKVKQIRNRVQAIHNMYTVEDKSIKFHPSSVNSGQGSFDSNFFVYFQKQRSTALYMLDATMVFPMSLLIFGDGVMEGSTENGEHYVSVAKKYYFKCDHRTCSIILKLRENLDLLLQKKALHPSPIQPNSNDDYLIKAIQILLSLDDVADHSDKYLSTDEDNDESS